MPGRAGHARCSAADHPRLAYVPRATTYVDGERPGRMTRLATAPLALSILVFAACGTAEGTTALPAEMGPELVVLYERLPRGRPSPT